MAGCVARACAEWLIAAFHAHPTPSSRGGYWPGVLLLLQLLVLPPTCAIQSSYHNDNHHNEPTITTRTSRYPRW
jgi:hypothetical protein